MVTFGEKEIAEGNFYATKNPIKNWDVNADYIIISKLIEKKTNSKDLIGLKLAKAIRPLVSIMSKMSGYIITFKIKEGNKHKNNKLMSFCIDDQKLLKKYEAIWIKIEDLKNLN